MGIVDDEEDNGDHDDDADKVRKLTSRSRSWTPGIMERSKS